MKPNPLELDEMQSIMTEILAQLNLPEVKLTQSAAARIYGRWFLDCVSKGDIKPFRVRYGRRVTKWYLVRDILLKQKELSNQINTI